MTQRILVVDDVPRNQKLLVDLLSASGYTVLTANSGESALECVARDKPALILLDVMMPGLSGYDVCRTIRQQAATELLPVVMVTALDPTERLQGLEAGADDFITKPIHRAELLARVRSLLRIKSLHDEVADQRAELAQWNRTLEERVAQGVAEVERLSRLKRFFSPAVAEMILAGATDDPLRSHRSEITVVALDLRGYTQFSESAHPEEVMDLLRQYHAAMGRLITRYQGTVERFAGDMIMIFFNDPVPIEEPAHHAVRMALDMQVEFASLSNAWGARGHAVGMGIGIACGPATLGAIGFEGRMDYGAIGTVCSLAARLCDQARPGQTLACERVWRCVTAKVVSEPVGPLELKGFRNSIQAFSIRASR